MKHPAPWRWVDDPGVKLVDAKGANIVAIDGFAVWGDEYAYHPSMGGGPPPAVRELIRLAPGMDRVLRMFAPPARIGTCAACGMFDAHAANCELVKVCAALRAAWDGDQ